MVNDDLNNASAQQKLKIIRENQLDFLFDLYKRGVPLEKEKIDLLIQKGRITRETPQPVHTEEAINPEVNRQLLSKKSPENFDADSIIDIFEETASPSHVVDIMTSTELERRRKENGHIFEGRTKEIDSSEWKPESTLEHKQDFVDWINSINVNGFENRIHYKKFHLYCQQAYTWLDENKNPSDFEDDELLEDYRQEELRRCDENALYFCNKYGYYQEGNADDGSGRIKYTARPNHEFMCYLEDCGYSTGEVKGRQQAVTTTKLLIRVRNIIFKNNYFIKYICEDEKKTVEIFEDKLKYPFSQLEDWMRPKVINDRDNLFAIGQKPEKGKKEGTGSRIRVQPPTRTAIAGGAPQQVDIDEAGNIDILGIMMGNIRPTMMWFNPATRKLELKRRINFWGTGGEMLKGGGALQTEFMAIYNAWMSGDYSHGIVPIFFNWTCRPGATQADYDRERTVAYSKANNPADPKGKQHITEFHQSWPRTLSDVFRSDANTLLDDEYIERNLQRIRDAKVKYGHTLHKSGFFEPVYDYNEVMPEGSDTPFKIVGATFVATSDIDPRASTIIFMEPERDWIDRYYQGTDPIDSANGTSKFASTIWDDHYNTASAILDWRIPDYPKVFLQSMLLGMYYDDRKQLGIRELMESNRGSTYYQYIKNKGYGKRAVIDAELPDHLQNRSAKNEGVGIDSHGDRTSMIVNYQYQMFNQYGENFYHNKLFEQAKTFTRIISKSNNGTGGGREMWGPSNRKYYTDDELWSTTYSYICAKMCFSHIHPVNVNELKKKVEIVYELVRDANGKLSRKAVRKSYVETV